MYNVDGILKGPLVIANKYRELKICGLPASLSVKTYTQDTPHMLRHQCICSICQCGRHKCPHVRPKQNKDAFCSATEYNDRYIGHTSQRQQALKPKSTRIASEEPLSDMTTHKADFVPLPLDPRKPKASPKAHVPEGVFEGQTMYTSDYTEKGITRVSPIRPQATERAQDRFDGEPTYTADYKEWDVEPHQSCGPQYKYRRPSTEFGGDPIYTTDYIDHGLVKPLGACRPVAQPIQSGPFSGITTFTADYVPKQGERQKACRPAYTPVHSDTPFAEDTTHRVDYTEKQIPERYHRTQEEYRANSAEFDDKTTYKSAYVPLEGERAKPIKPAYQPLDPNRAMTDDTVYKKEYRRWSLKDRPKPAHCPAKYLPPETPFGGQTNYQSEYVPKERDACPAGLLEGNQDIICEGEDESGHQFYSTKITRKKKKTTMVMAT